MSSRWHPLKCLIALVFAAASAPTAHALVSLPPAPISLEWAVEQAPRIVRGTVPPGMVRPVKLNDVPWLEVTLDVGETFKGEPADQLTFLAPTSSGLDQAARSSWADVLVFLEETTPAARANAAGAQLAAWTVWSQRSFLLAQPPPFPTFRMDGSQITDGPALVQAVREAAAHVRQRQPPNPRAFVLFGEVLPPDLPTNQLIVPADARLEALARRWATDPNVNVRADSIRVLAEFHSPKNVGLLRQMLADPTFSVVEEEDWVPRPGDRAWRFFLVRAVAAQQLNKWNEPGGADAVFRAPLVRYWPLYWRRRALAAAAVLLALLLWPRRLRGPTPGTVGVIACAALLAALALLWHRGTRVTDTLSAAAGNGNWELTLGAGRLAVLRVQDDAPPHGWLIRSFERPADAPPAWFAPMLTPREDIQRAGVHLAEGVTRGPGAYWYNLLELPYWLLAGALFIWPAAWSLRQLRCARLRERRRREGRCGACGYSLHGIATARCPECGAPTHSAEPFQNLQSR